jgi:uncharacterized protein (DUF305 family)
MMATRSIIAFAVCTLLAGAASVVSAQGGHDMAGMHMGPEIVIPKGAIYTKADVEFMQGMIAHHAQAIVMSRMAEAHGASPQVLKLSNKIDQSQVPEILIMQEWLRRYKQFVPDTSSWRHMKMDGMLTDEQLKELDASKVWPLIVHSHHDDPAPRRCTQDGRRPACVATRRAGSGCLSVRNDVSRPARSAS